MNARHTTERHIDGAARADAELCAIDRNAENRVSGNHRFERDAGLIEV